MKKIFVISPRQTGKTDKAIYEFLKDPEHTLFVCHNLKSVENVYNRIKKFKHNIVSSNNIGTKIRGMNIKKIILDEYLFFNEKDKIEIYQQLNNRYNLYIFSTSNKIYSSILFNIIKNAKKNKTELSDDIKQLFSMKEIDELMNNFLTDPDVKIIDEFKIMNQEKIDQYPSILNSIVAESYFLEVLNKYLD